MEDVSRRPLFLTSPEITVSSQLFFREMQQRMWYITIAEGQKHGQQIQFHITALLQVQILPVSEDAVVKRIITAKKQPTVLCIMAR